LWITKFAPWMRLGRGCSSRAANKILGN
jgi:hypothetical protein